MMCLPERTRKGGSSRAGVGLQFRFFLVQIRRTKNGQFVIFALYIVALGEPSDVDVASSQAVLCGTHHLK